MKYFALIYYVVDDYVKKREPFRKEHLGLASEAADNGQLLLGGALTDPFDRALLVFRVQDMAIVEEFVSKDPYFKNGLVQKYEIKEWKVVAGKDAVV